MIYSFDIFDTLIKRKVASSLGILSIMQDRLNCNCKYSSINEDLRKNWLYARVFCESKVKNSQLNEISIYDILDYISKVYYLSIDDKLLLLNLEIETELDNVIPIQQNIDIVKSKKKEGHKIIFISDMYLSRIIIHEMLEFVSSGITNNIDLIISSEVNKSKYNGTIYPYILNKYSISHDEIYHLGDNYHSDIYMAEMFKIKSTLYQPLQLNEFEILLKNNQQTNTVFQLFLGASREAREGKSEYFFNLGCSIAGPCLYFFAKWIIEKSLEMSATTIIFFQNEEKTLFKILSKFLKMQSIKLNLTILPFPIQFLDLINLNENAIINYLLEHIYDLGLNSIIDDLGITDNELNILLHESGFLIKDRNNIDEYDFENNSRFKLNILAIVNIQKKKLKKYILNLPDLRNTVVGYVNFSWTNIHQDNLFNIINESGLPIKRLCGFYFGLEEYSLRTNNKNIKIPFIFHPYSHYNLFNKSYLKHFSHLFDFTTNKVDQNNNPLCSIYEISNSVKFRKGIEKFIDYLLKNPFSDNLEMKLTVCYYIETLKSIFEI